MRKTVKLIITFTLLCGALVVGTNPSLGQTMDFFAKETLYADGSVDNCIAADDLTSPAGKVIINSTSANGVHFVVILQHAAANWDYYVEFNHDGICYPHTRFYGLTTDEYGKGVLSGFYELPPGSYSFQVNIVSDPPHNIPPNFKHREIATSGLIDITVR